MNENKKYCSVHELASYLNISPRRVQMLVERGIISRDKRGQYELIPAIHSYIDHLKNVIARSTARYARTVYSQMAKDKKRIIPGPPAPGCSSPDTEEADIKLKQLFFIP